MRREKNLTIYIFQNVTNLDVITRRCYRPLKNFALRKLCKRIGNKVLPEGKRYTDAVQIRKISSIDLAINRLKYIRNVYFGYENE